MTTTDVYQGLQGTKNSSRVLAAPGGKSSISFGDSDSNPTASKANRESHSKIFGEESVPSVDAGPDALKAKKIAKGQGMYNPTTGDGHTSGYNVVTGEEYGSHHESDHNSPRQKYANDQTRGAYNPITGEMYDDSPKAAAAAAEEKKTPVSKDDKGRGDFNPITGEAYKPNTNVHTSTRVRQPPGGASSKLW